MYLFVIFLYTCIYIQFVFVSILLPRLYCYIICFCFDAGPGGLNCSGPPPPPCGSGLSAVPGEGGPPGPQQATAALGPGTFVRMTSHFRLWLAGWLAAVPFSNPVWTP